MHFNNGLVLHVGLSSSSVVRARARTNRASERARERKRETEREAVHSGGVFLRRLSRGEPLPLLSLSLSPSLPRYNQHPRKRSPSWTRPGVPVLYVRRRRAMAPSPTARVERARTYITTSLARVVSLLATSDETKWIYGSS